MKYPIIFTALFVLYFGLGHLNSFEHAVIFYMSILSACAVVATIRDSK